MAASMRDETTVLATTVFAATSDIQLRQHVIAEKPTGFVAGEHAPPRWGRHADGAPVGVGIECDGHVGVHLGRQREQQVGGAGLLGVGERDGGEVGVGCELFGDDVDVGEAGLSQCVHGHLAADAVHRRQRHADVPGRPSDLRGPPDVVADQFGVGGCDRRACDVGGAFDIAVSMSRSVGGTICMPPSK